MKKSGREKLFFAGLAAAAAALAAWEFFSGAPPSVQNFSYYADRGGALLYAFADKSVSFSMPLLSLAASAAERFNISPSLFGRLAGLLICLPAYSIGARGGRTRGALFALAAALTGVTCSRPEAEQSVYSLLLLLFLSVELKRQAAGGLRLSAASGLAAGFTLLVRSPLFLFPPLAEAYRAFSHREETEKRLRSAALFLAASWILLLPWAGLNYSLFGRLIPLEEGRPVSNIISGASGFVYTMEGDARAFAGLSRTESVYPWAAKTVASAPARYAAALAKRLWGLFLMYPLLFLLAAAGLFVTRREKDARFLAFFCAYFAAVHCLLSIEERYFQPLRYALALLAAGGAWKVFPRFSAEKQKDPFTAPLFAAAAAAAAAVTAVILLYPSRAAHPLVAAERAIGTGSPDPWLYKRRGEALLSLDLPGPALEDLRRACAISHDKSLCYAAETAASEIPGIPPSTEDRYELLMIKLARELALGLRGAARATFGEAMGHYLKERNAVKGKPDSDRLERILLTNRTLWDIDIPRGLRYLPIRLRSRALRGLAEITTLTEKLRALELQYRERLDAKGREELAGLERRIWKELPAAEFDWAGASRQITAGLIEKAVPFPDTGGHLGLLIKAGGNPAETVRIFDTHCRGCAGRAARAAAMVLMSKEKARTEHAEELVRSDPDNFSYSLVLMAAEGFSPEALARAEERLEMNPYPLAAGALALARTRPEEALGLADRAAVSPHMTEDSWSLLLLAAQEAGKPEAGLKLAGAALRSCPRSSRLLNDRGVLRHLSGDPGGALEDFRAAEKADPSNRSALMNLGGALERSGDGKGAEAAYARAEKARR